MTGPRRSVLLLPVGDERVASVRYRVLSHRPALEAAGFETRVRLPIAAGARGLAARASRLLDLVRDAAGRDPEPLVLVHRKTYPPPFARRLRRPGRFVVFDFDDALDLPPPGREAEPATLARYRRNFDATVREADLVLCGNDDLAGRVPHGRCEVLATPVDTDRFRPGAVAAPSDPTVGWVGHSDNLPYLESLSDVFLELARRHRGFRLIVVADRAPSLPGVEVEFRRWTLDAELSCFGDMAAGVMPLPDTDWARAKCAFKALQYMALGIPTVASPVGMNREVIRHGESGFLPATHAEWVACLDTLLRDRERARAVGEAGRRTVEERYALVDASRRIVALLEDGLRAVTSPARRRG